MDTSTRSRRPWRAFVWVTGVVIIASAAVWQQRAAAQRSQGRALFHGETALPGRLPFHPEWLPTVATRCSNCHEQTNRAPGTAASPAATGASAGSYALALARDGLTRPRSRRGGPPSAYDSAAFCQLLRSGIDPAQVIIGTEMPRYEATNEQCQQLWAYLLSR